MAIASSPAAHVSAPHPTVVAARNAIDQRRIPRAGGVELHAHAAIRLLAHAGSVRVQFDATGSRDPALIDRVSRSYDSRMGR